MKAVFAYICLGAFLASLSICFLPAPAFCSNESTYYRAWELVRDNYCDRQKLDGWQQWRDRYHGKLHTREDLRAAIKSMLKSLGDDYSYMLSPADICQRNQDRNLRGVVSSSRLPENLGYIRISSLASTSAPKEFRQAMKRLGDVRGYIIDLRDNHGGLIDTTDDLFSMLTDAGSFMTCCGSKSGRQDTQSFTLTSAAWQIQVNGRLKLAKRVKNLCGNKPLFVLVNEDTRSAAELLAGSLRQNRRALIIGTRTFGKGVLQDSFRLDRDVEIKMVTARYFLPDGSSVHDRGLSPDIEVSAVQEGTLDDPQLNQAMIAAGQAIAHQCSVQL